MSFEPRKFFWQREKRAIKAVDGIDLVLERGRTLALVGESGCGKTTVALSVLRLLPEAQGEIWFSGTRLDADNLDAEALRNLRRKMQMIFQDPASSMNPRHRVFDIVAEGLKALGMDKKTMVARVEALLEQVGLSKEAMQRYPHEFSGGQRQRICIARALAVSPELLICDEPTSALDVSVQAQILNLLRQLQQELGLSYLFITHNLAVVAYLADEVAVMYLGRIVEKGPARTLLSQPQHPYTQSLLASVPELEREKSTLLKAHGEVPSLINPPKGCHFHPRCPHATARCAQKLLLSST